MQKGKIIILSGPSGSGKTTLYKKLLANWKIKNCPVKSISVTTRPKRVGEKHGRDYFFVSKKMFLYKKRSSHFLESEKVFDNYYGTPNKIIRGLLRAGKNVLMCIDVKGAKTVRRKFPKAVTIFIKTSSLKVLAARLKRRGSEQKNIMKFRLQTARKELREIKKYNYVIVNNDLRKAYRRLRTIIREELDRASAR